MHISHLTNRLLGYPIPPGCHWPLQDRSGSSFQVASLAGGSSWVVWLEVHVPTYTNLGSCKFPAERRRRNQSFQRSHWHREGRGSGFTPRQLLDPVATTLRCNGQRRGMGISKGALPFARLAVAQHVPSVAPCVSICLPRSYLGLRSVSDEGKARSVFSPRQSPDSPSPLSAPNPGWLAIGTCLDSYHYRLDSVRSFSWSFRCILLRCRFASQHLCHPPRPFQPFPGQSAAPTSTNTLIQLMWTLSSPSIGTRELRRCLQRTGHQTN
ncbi:hypothetical protein F5Y14DRAFT_234888 [Nemania sp. NC0429]|nr:hypothetical protein F5Y14DRAFT_234888 [Nemania sp. NC0429]